MTELFPSQAYRELCIENQQKLREEWVPRFGDWAIERHSKDIVLIVKHWADFVEFVPLSWENYEEGYIHTGHKKNFIPLFQPHQFIQTLEERGCLSWVVGRVAPDHPRCDPTEEVKEVATIVADEGGVTIRSLAEEILGCSRSAAYSYLSSAVELGLLEVDRTSLPFRFYARKSSDGREE